MKIVEIKGPEDFVRLMAELPADARRDLTRHIHKSIDEVVEEHAGGEKNVVAEQVTLIFRLLINKTAEYHDTCDKLDKVESELENLKVENANMRVAMEALSG